ncbi:MAG: ABC transporter permease, partial [Cytophagaceae bacterium]|nr:ABC transporter permease [Gemmatimonadaceae bacterium]
AILAGVVAGLPQAFFWGRADLGVAFRGAGAARSGSNLHLPRLRTLFLVAQGALSVMLLVGAGLFVRSLGRVTSMRLGYDPDGVILATQNLRGERIDEAGLIVLRRTLLTAAQGIAGVEAASAVMTVPLLRTNATSLFVPGIDSVERFGQFTYQSTTPDYFRVMGTRLVRGRGITELDHADAPRVVVVGATMARTLWPGEEAIGKCMRVFADTMPCATVVGVAEDMVQQGLLDGARLHYYLPMEQFWPGGAVGLLLKVRGDAVVDDERIRRALQQVMPGASYVTTQRMSDVVDAAHRSWQLGATMFGALGLLALVVAAVGLYGVVSYDVAQRMHELGVRVALGARAGDAMRLVVGHGLRQAGMGIALGTALALAGSRWLEPLLFSQRAWDPGVFAIVIGLLVGVTILASAIPALRAARADPNVVLRSTW